MEGLRQGDVVMLKSGGPKMTVVDVALDYRQQDEVTCKWFAEAEVRTARFYPGELVKVEEGEEDEEDED
jgi:uncharacterized protein YodC (DUF2158 family)